MGTLTMTPEIEEFAKKLIEYVRDASIKSSDSDLRPSAPSPVAKRWRQASRDERSLDFARIIIPDVVDESSIFFRPLTKAC
jgi:hypothetical protein